MAESARYVLWGSAGHAKVLASLIALRGGRVVALFDNDPAAVASLPGVPLHIGKEGFVRWAEAEPARREIFGLAAIGGERGRDRLVIHEIFRSQGLRTQIATATGVAYSAALEPNTAAYVSGNWRCEVAGGYSLA